MIPADFDFRSRIPPSPLDRAVDRVWYARGTSPHGRERILPSPAAVLLVVLGPPLRMTPPGDPAAPAEVSGAWIHGPHDAPFVNEPTGETHVLGVSFTPGGVSAFLADSADAVANRLLPLTAVDTPLCAEAAWTDGLRRLDDPDDAMARVVAWLEGAHDPDTLADAWQDAVLALADGRTRTVAEVRRRLGVSRRHFVERIRGRAGLAPKALQRIGRLRRLLDEIDARRPVRWSAEAVGAGYFDQPHAIRDFRAFTGMTPTEYVERRRRAWGHDVEPGEAANFVPDPRR